MFKALLLCLVGGVLSIYAAVDLMNGRALDARGVSTTLERPEQVTQLTHKKGGRVDRITYEGQVSFVTESGERITVKKSLATELVEKWQRGEDVEVLYLPDKPRTVRLEGERNADRESVVLGLLILAVGVFLFRRELHKPPQARDY